MIITSVGKGKALTSSDITDALGYTPQNAATAITTSNISSQSVNYANSSNYAYSAGSASSATRASTLSSALSTSLGGVPSGGSANQVLMKNSATNYDLKWGNAGGVTWTTLCTIPAGDYTTSSAAIYTKTTDTTIINELAQARVFRIVLDSVAITSSYPLYISYGGRPGSSSADSIMYLNNGLTVNNNVVYYWLTGRHFNNQLNWRPTVEVDDWGFSLNVGNPGFGPIYAGNSNGTVTTTGTITIQYTTDNPF